MYRCIHCQSDDICDLLVASLLLKKIIHCIQTRWSQVIAPQYEITQSLFLFYKRRPIKGGDVLYKKAQQFTSLKKQVQGGEMD